MVMAAGRGRYVDLGARERQIVDALYRLRRATVSEVLGELADPPSYSAVRTMLGKLERKGHVRHDVDGPRFVYFAAIPRQTAQTSALRRILRSLFDNSPQQAVAAILGLSRAMSEVELDDLERLIAERRGKPRRKA